MFTLPDIFQYGNELSGKTSVIRYLAHISGRSLTVVSATPSLDATDLLGSFEQVRKQIHFMRLKISVLLSFILLNLFF